MIEGYPAFFMSFEPDGRKINGRFLPTVLRRAAPNAVAILACFLILLAVPLGEEQSSTVFYLLVGTVGIMAVFKASWPMSRLRAFLCTNDGRWAFYAAVLLFHSLLHVEPLETANLPLLISLALVSFLIERGAAALIKRFDSHICNGDANFKGGRQTVTIRKRLYISNILMLVIPAVISVLALAAGVLAVLTAASPGGEHDLASEHELGELRSDIVGMAADYLATGGSAGQLESES